MKFLSTSSSFLISICIISTCIHSSNAAAQDPATADNDAFWTLDPSQIPSQPVTSPPSEDSPGSSSGGGSPAETIMMINPLGANADNESPVNGNASIPSVVVNNGTSADESLVWMPCPQMSQSSFVNFTFSPYPLRRGQDVNVTLNGFITEDIPVGTMLTMKSRLASFPLIPGPRLKLDICDYIEKQFANAPRPIRCPINKWAILLVLHAISQQQSEGSSESLSVRVPRTLIPGNYRATVKLETKAEDVLTCATAILRVK